MSQKYIYLYVYLSAARITCLSSKICEVSNVSIIEACTDVNVLKPATIVHDIFT